MKWLDTRLAIVAVVLLAGTAATASAQAAPGAGRMNRAQVERAVAGWPTASRDAVMFMMTKYGVPAAVSADAVMWGHAGCTASRSWR